MAYKRLTRVHCSSRAKHRSDLALAIPLAAPKALTSHAGVTSPDVSLVLLLHNRLLQVRHERLAVLDRETNGSGDQANPYLYLLLSWTAVPNSSVPSIVIVRRIAVYHEIGNSFPQQALRLSAGPPQLN
jgi:hypothetical protein